MTISVKAAINSHVNQIFQENRTADSLDFLERLYLSEFAAIKEQANHVLNRAFLKMNHSDAYVTILNYTLEHYSLTQTIALLGAANLEGEDDIVEHNLILLATEVASYDNSWKFFKKCDLVGEVKDILTSTKPQPIALIAESLTANG